MKQMEARFDGKCAKRCGLPVVAGQWILYGGRGTTQHVDCEAVAAAAAERTRIAEEHEAEARRRASTFEYRGGGWPYAESWKLAAGKPSLEDAVDSLTKANPFGLTMDCMVDFQNGSSAIADVKRLAGLLQFLGGWC